MNILAFLPAAILGVVGGLLGALFTFLNLKICRLRRYILGLIKNVWKQNALKILEPVLIMVRRHCIGVIQLAVCKPVDIACDAVSKQITVDFVRCIC